MFVASNSYRQLFDWAKLKLQERLEPRLCLLDVSGLFKCFLQQAGGFKADAEGVRALMISNRKEWRTGETVCGRGETKIAFAAGRCAGNGNDCFCRGERSLTLVSFVLEFLLSSLQKAYRRFDGHKIGCALEIDAGGYRADLKVVRFRGDGPF